MSCSNNLKQIGLALHSYHGDNGRFPPAVAMPYAVPEIDPLTGGSANPFGPNWAVFLLPYIEQENLYRQANPQSYAGTNNLSNLGSYNLSWRGIRAAKIKTYLSPSDTAAATPSTPPTGLPPHPPSPPDTSPPT